MKIAVFGCGLIGRKRGLQIGSNELVGLYDPNLKCSESLAADLKTKIYPSEDSMIKESGADIFIIATINNQLAPLTKKCVMAKKHVLVEKPGAISVQELYEI